MAKSRLLNFAFLFALLGVLWASGGQSSAAAPEAQQDENGGNNSKIVSTDDTVATSTTANNKTASHKGFAKRTLGVVTGMIIGTPVCAVRKPIDEEKYGIDSLSGGNKRGKVVVPSAIFWAPFSTVAGVLEAPFWALNNSLVNLNEPFSKEQMSLKEKHVKDAPDPVDSTSRGGK